MIQHSEQLDKLAAALAKAQAEVKGAKKDASNPFFKTTYADLASVWEACREALTSNGLSVVQFPGFENGVATLDTVLLHSSGQWLSGTAGAPLTKLDAQGVGSALTYLRRYALAAVASVSPEDDDGNAASRAPRRGVAAGNPDSHGVTPQSERGQRSGGGGSVTRAAAGPSTGGTSPDSTPKRITEADQFPTRDTPWPGADKLHRKSVREWALNQLRAADAGEVRIPEEWLAIVRLELKARAAKVVAG